MSYMTRGSRVSLKISKDEAARKAKQNQEWGTTTNQNPESNSNNKQISKRGINREAPNSDKPKPKRESCTRYACQRQEKRDKREAFPTATFPRPYCSRR